MRFFLSVLTALLFVACSQAERRNELPDFEHIVVVGTNDVHGHLRVQEKSIGAQTLLSGGSEWFAGYVNILRAKYGDHLILLDGGDLFQGTLDSNFYYGAPLVDVYNYLRYTATAVGNHEFDYGTGNSGSSDHLRMLKDRIAQAKFPFLAANIYAKGTKSPWQEENLHPHILLSVGDIKIGVLGLTTRTTVSKTLPINIAALDFGDFAEAANREAAELRAAGADLVLITTHEGDFDTHPLREMLQKLKPGTIDGIVAGHTHTEIHEFIEGVPVIESKTQGKFFGRIDFYVNKRTKKIDPSLTKIQDMHAICGNWYANSETCDPRQALNDKLLPLRPAMYEGGKVEADLHVREILAPYFAKVDSRRLEPMGNATRNFIYMKDGESEAGGVFASGLFHKFPEAKAVYLNGGGLRGLFLKGPISYGDVYEIYPFDNFAVEVKMTGKEFKKLLAVGLGGGQSIPYVSGVQVSYRKDNEGHGKLVSVKWPNGKAVRDSETFGVATTDYLLAGGDHCGEVFSAIPDSRKHYSEITIRDAAAEYLRSHPKAMLPEETTPHFKVVP